MSEELVGRTVYINMEGVKDPVPPWDQKSRLIGTVKDVSSFGGTEVVRFVAECSENNIDEEEWGKRGGRGWVRGTEYITDLSCPNCDSELTFHDKEEEWVCPFCDLGEIKSAN